MTGSLAEELQTKRLRFLTRRDMTADQRLRLSQLSQVTFLAMEAIGERGELDLSCLRDIEDVRSGYTQFFDGDVIVAKITPCFENGKGALVQGTLNGVGFGTTELHVLRPGPELEGRFLYYVTVSELFRRLGEAAMTGAAGQKRVPEDFVRDYRIPVPSLLRQRAISDFLDRETARLDSLVAAKERLLRLLEEKQRAMVTRAISRGLNLQGSLCDSGLPWLEKIPAHWDIWKIGHFAAVGHGYTPSRERDDYWTGGTIPWLSSSVVNQPEVTSAGEFVTEIALRECHLPVVEPGSVLVGITGQGKTRGLATVLSIGATVNQNLAYITPNSGRVHPWFLRWVLFAAYDYLRVISDDPGGTQGALTGEELAALRVPLPALTEQRAIVEHISKEMTKLDAMRRVSQRTIDLLKERRSALITAAVTGQLEVIE